MIVGTDIACAEKICVIVNSGQGSKVLKSAKRHGIPGGTILLGRGTASGRILEFLGLNDVRKEIVLMVAGRKTARAALEMLHEEFRFERPNHGIAFATRVTSLAGSRTCAATEAEDDGGEKRTMFHAITVIVEKGRAELAVEAAARAGAKGGTILNGRGAGVHETKKLFNLDFEPEREMALILAAAADSDAIVEAIRKDLDLDVPGMGILFVQEVTRAYGLVE